jgi:site-specific recombinase XerD
MSLEPIEPEAALELFLKYKEAELADASIKGHDYRLRHFVRWCHEQGIENLNTFTGRQLHEYRLWRRDDGDLNKVSEKTQMDSLRSFVRWLEAVDGVEQDLSEKVLSPTITADENSRDVMLNSEQAASVLSHLEKYEYARPQHVALTLMWHTMMRVGGVHAMNVDDYNADEQYMKVRHRPDTDTPIKNKGDGERLVALSDDIYELLDGWLENKRPDTTDDHGRKPLLASREGRLQKMTLRMEECPHDRDPGDCEATERDAASKCPSSVSPHAIRRGSITHSLNSDMPDRVVSDRANVSPKVIEQHYDRRTEQERMEQRRDYLDNL